MGFAGVVTMPLKPSAGGRRKASLYGTCVCSACVHG